MKCHLVTTPLQFRFPLRRELFIAAGIITTDAESIEYVLNKEEKGQLVCIVPGGAEESLDSHPDNYDLTLLNRKGFVRIAIKTGAALVPVYNFGENRCFYQVPNKRGTFIRKLQSWFKRMLGFAPCIWSGVGVLNNYIGFMPFATPITTVVGEPLTIPHDPNPSKELIERTHAKYVGALIKLFDDNKARYGIDESVELRIV
uniref:diacylglycerol O-acyltransferase n=1 Tax=Panagrellus redivivus TaxID=6233 RepID=A0A7E4UT99_PANRE